jgi:hypothetical protein
MFKGHGLKKFPQKINASTSSLSQLHSPQSFNSIGAQFLGKVLITRGPMDYSIAFIDIGFLPNRTGPKGRRRTAQGEALGHG